MSSQEPHSGESRRQYSFGDFTLNLEGGFLCRGREEIALRPKSFEVLGYLVECHGRLVNREELMRAVWPDIAVTDESVTKCIADIRKALADDAQQLVRTVARRGYMFTAPVITPVLEFPHPSSSVEAKPGPLPVPPNPATMKASVRRWLWVGIAVMVLVAAGFGSWMTLRRLRPEPIRSILVLPFVNMSSSAEDEYLGDGLSEEVINALAAIPSLQVVARTSAFQLKGTRQDIRQIGIQFHADTVLEGSVRRQGDRVRITAQLNSARDGYHLWSQTWDHDLRDVFAIQRLVSEGIARTLRAGTREVRSQPGTSNPEAYRLYLRGIFEGHKSLHAENLRTAIEFLKRAVDLDPNFGRAWAQLSMFYGLLESPETGIYVRKALALDDSLTLAHLVKAAGLFFVEWNFRESEREIRRSIELDPSFARAHAMYAYYLMIAGQPEKALTEAKLARTLDPLDMFVAKYLARIQFLTGHFNEGVATAREVLEFDPRIIGGDGAMINASLLDGGRYEEALDWLKRAGFAQPYYDGLREALAKHGPQGFLHAEARLRERGIPSRNPMMLALAYARLRDTDRCLAWLERAVDQHDFITLTVRLQPALNYLHGNSRYEALVRKIGLP